MNPPNSPSPPPPAPLQLVVMGVSGSGKTTLAAQLAHHLGWPVAEADDFHPPANIAKMTAGSPLTDDDRQPWLTAIRDWMAAHAAAGRGSIVTCSALKRGYRNLLREAAWNVCFIHLTGDPAVLADRMKQRTGHFMPASLLPSQLLTLEPLEADEYGLSLPNNTTPVDLATRALAALERLQPAPPPQPELP